MMREQAQQKGTPGARAWLPVPLVTTGRWLRRAGVLGQVLTLLIVFAIFAIGTNGRFLSLANLQVILSLAAIPAIIAIGLHHLAIVRDLHARPSVRMAYMDMRDGGADLC